MNLRWIVPDWPAPPPVRAVTTLRGGGASLAPYDSLNLAGHVGDEPSRVAANRQRLAAALALPAAPLWLDQRHGDRVIDAGGAEDLAADGACARRPGLVCAVLTADCLPILLCNRKGRAVAALHAGWRGLACGIVESGLEALRGAPEDLLAWLGPAICGGCYEVGEEVRQAFLGKDAALAPAFTPTRPGHFLVDLCAIARHLLEQRGVRAIFGGDRCTRHEPDRFYSHRRDGRSGRMASLVWIQPED